MGLIEEVEETRSTNDDVTARAREGAAEGLWLRADRQTGGRGRQGRDWHSPAGNLHASTLVRVRQDDPPAPTLALVAGVALHEAASAYAPRQKLILKWPNDLLACFPAGPESQGSGAAGPLPSPGNMMPKLAGILLERAEDAVVIGIGVNLAHHPQDIGRPATSLAALAGTAPDPRAFLEVLADALARWLARWRGEGLSRIRRHWLAAAHPVGTALSTSAGEGLFDGLDETGALRLRLADGTVHVIHAGDIFLI